MLPKTKRLNLKTNFGWVAKGTRSRTPNLTIFFALGQNSEPKIGVSLSKKNFNKAILRNRAKRLVFSVVERVYSRLPENINLILMPKSSILEQDPEKLEDELKKALRII